MRFGSLNRQRARRRDLARDTAWHSTYAASVPNGARNADDRVFLEQQVMAQLEKVLTVEREIKRAQLGLMVRLKGKLTLDQQAHLRQLREKPAGN